VDALGNFTVMIASIVLLPFLVIGALARRSDRNFQPWFVYTFVAFAGATILYPLHVPGGAFIHTAIGLAPHAAILAMEGVLIFVSWIAGRRRRWEEGAAGSFFVWGIVALTVATAVVFTPSVYAAWDASRQPRIALATELDQLGVPKTDRLLSIDAAGMKYWTGRPGVVTPDDPIDVIESVAKAYDTRWLVLERNDAARALGPVLEGNRPPWIGPPAWVYPPDAQGHDVRLGLYPLCLGPDTSACR
jgi:hypothetical protein